ncbi:hypothetical protein [Haloarcula pellucida]|uniref:Uncharacterized protein n=1 Tax=Haloarcula pellucida TaxID=1427151 RepID=A0A830GMQ7_9EURY|nr:hypothetical protein [Halomicroarcula pellucida]MBX0349071.1 hypothetical protein [Halomicroarcula pellucida]GGN98856.1 hypothetical protein GCM10009030_29770 [Halomicroarcula pellucida]
MSDDPVSVTRRDVVRTGGVLGGSSLLGVVGTASAGTTTRVVEVAAEFAVDAPEDVRLRTLHVDGAPPYRVATDDGLLVSDPYGPLTAADRSLLDDAAFVVRDAVGVAASGDRLATTLTARDETVRRLPRRLAPDYRAAYAVRLAAPLDVRVPSVTRVGEAARVTLGSDRYRVPPGETLTLERPERTVTVERRTVREADGASGLAADTGDPAALADVPPAVETGTAELHTAVTPVVRVRNLGRLTVEHGRR